LARQGVTDMASSPEATFAIVAAGPRPVHAFLFAHDPSGRA
jgi:hypothetical protein